MANLQRTTTIAGTCSRQDLYDLIANANIINASEADRVNPNGAVVSITAATLAPSVLQDTTWWYDQFDQLLKMPVTYVGSTPASFYMSVGPDRWDAPGYNIASVTLAKGYVVRFSYSAGAGIYDCTYMEPNPTWYTATPWLRKIPELRSVYGIAAADIPPGQFGPVTTMGFVHVKVDYLSCGPRTSACKMNYAPTLFIHTSATGVAMGPATFVSPDEHLVTMVGVALSMPGVGNTAATQLCPAFVRFPLGSARPARN
jgi:hypothetical protein